MSYIYRRDRNDGGDNEDESDDVVLPLQCAHTHTQTHAQLYVRDIYVCNSVYTLYYID